MIVLAMAAILVGLLLVALFGWVSAAAGSEAAPLLLFGVVLVACGIWGIYEEARPRLDPKTHAWQRLQQAQKEYMEAR